MSLIESNFINGVRCDVRDCATEVRLAEPVPAWSVGERVFRETLHAAGWVIRVGRSRTWFCPDHAGRAYRCLKGKWGYCSPWCPVHKDGRVITEARR